MADQLVNREERVGGAEVAQDLEFRQHSWRVQRVGWAALALLTGAALLGPFGKGPLCRTTAGVPAGDLGVDREKGEGCPIVKDVSNAVGSHEQRFFARSVPLFFARESALMLISLGTSPL